MRKRERGRGSIVLRQLWRLGGGRWGLGAGEQISVRLGWMIRPCMNIQTCRRYGRLVYRCILRPTPRGS